MPFTLAHPAAVLPIGVKDSEWLDATALFLGSMAPDFEYFIRFQPQAVFGHTFWGFVWYNLPLVLLMAYLWQHLIKKPFLRGLPNVTYPYVAPLYHRRWKVASFKQLFVFLASALIGMLTHVFWDAFTHIDAFFVMRISLLQINIEIFSIKVAVYQILQQSSTLLGFVALFVYLRSLSKREHSSVPKMNPKKKFIFWVLIMLIASFVFFIRMFFTLDEISLRYYGIYIVSFISGFMIGTVAICLLYRMKWIHDQ